MYALVSLGRDGASYRELKAFLAMQDGILYSNLKALEEMQYVKFEKSKGLKPSKELDVIVITPEGKAALEKTKTWLKQLVETKVI